MPQSKTVNQLRQIEGVYYQPRAYWDSFKFAPGDFQSFGSNEVFYNRTRNPIRITHITMCMGLPTPSEIEEEAAEIPPAPPFLQKADERLINNFALRVIGHDLAYQSELPLPLPLWNNMNNTASSSVNRGTVSWQFDRPLRQAAGDTFDFDIMPIQPFQTSGPIISVGLTGIGMQSRDPYFMGTRTVPDGVAEQATTALSRIHTRNEGVEPILYKQMAMHITGELAGHPLGDARNLLLRAKQNGSGSQQDWFVGPRRNDLTCSDKIPAALLGLQTGRCIVHRLSSSVRGPDDRAGDVGWLWNPGQGLELEMTNLDPSRTVTERVWVGLLGHSIHS